MIWVNLCGGNAAGKTTLLTQIQEEYKHDPQVRCIFADIEEPFKEESSKQFRACLEAWNDDQHKVIIADGTRIYQKVFMAYEISTVERRLVFVILLQQPEVMKAHLMMRCEKRNKKFRDEYWTPEKCLYEGRRRYTNAVDKFMRSNPNLPLEVFKFEVDVDFTTTPTIKQKLRELISEGTCESSPRSSATTAPARQPCLDD